MCWGVCSGVKGRRVGVCTVCACACNTCACASRGQRLRSSVFFSQRQGRVSRFNPKLADPVSAVGHGYREAATLAAFYWSSGIWTLPLNRHSQHFARRASPLPRHFHWDQRKFSNMRKDVYSNVQEREKWGSELHVTQCVLITHSDSIHA